MKSRVWWWLGLVAALAVPVGLLVYWHSLNQSYPRDDEGDYAQIAQAIYLKFRASGFFGALSDAYLTRGWRPILHPVVGAPFFIALGGKVQLAVKAATAFTFSVFAVFVYRSLARLSGVAFAVLGTWFIATIPWILRSFFIFSSESTLLACAAAIFFYFLESDLFRSRRGTLLFALWLGLGFCVRPNETLFMSWGVPLAIASAVGLKRRSIRPRELVALGLIFLVAAAVVGTAAIKLQQNLALYWVPALLALLAPAWWLARRAGGTATPFFEGGALFYGIVFFWFDAFGHSLFEWSYACSFGEFAKMLGGRENLTRIEYLRDLFAWLGNAPLAILVFVAAIGLALRRARLEGAFACLAPIAVAPTVLGLLSHNGSYRYYYTSFFVSFLLALTLAARAIAWDWLKYALALVLAAANIVFGPPLATERIADLARRLEFSTFYQNVQPETVPPPAAGVLEQIEPYLKNEPNARVSVLMMAQNTDTIGKMINPPTLAVMALEKGYAWSFRFPFFSPGTTPERRVEDVRAQDDYVLIGYDYVEPEPWVDKPGFDFATSMPAAKIVTDLERGKLEELHLELLMRSGPLLLFKVRK